MHWKTIIRNNWQDGTFLFVSLMYSLLLLRWGYVFGRSDQNEILPYALWLNHPELYPKDLFLQGIVNIIPNERWTTAHLLSLLGKFLEPGVFILHAICSLSLLYGLSRIFRHFLQSTYLSWIGIFLTLIVFYLWNPGANELYYNFLIPASFAKGLGIWAFYFWLKEKPYRAVFFLIPATLFHPIAGLQLAMLMFGVGFFMHIKSLFKQPHIYLYPLLLYMLTAFVFVLAIKLNYEAHGPSQPNSAFFKQIFDFRNGHHYLPSLYPMRNWIFAAGCWILAFWQWKERQIRLWLLLLLAGCIVYTFGVEVLESPTIAAFQWFKATIWLQILGLAALLKMIENFLLVRGPRIVDVRLAPALEKALLSAGLLGAVVVLLFFTAMIPWKAPFDLGKQKQTDDLIAACIRAKAQTPIDALFIHPFEVSESQYYMQRSVYVSYKANLKQNAGAKIWSDRIAEIYGLSWQEFYPDKKAAAKKGFLSLGEEDLLALQKKGVTHILTYREHILPQKWLLFQHKNWSVYQLPE